MFNWIFDGGVLSSDVFGWQLLEQTGAVPTAGYLHTLTALDGNLHLIGGSDSATVYPQHARYIPATGEWATSKILATRWTHSANAINRDLYVIGGRATNTVASATDKVYRYNLDADAWVGVTPLPTTLFGHCSAVAGDFIYVYGGATASNAVQNALYRYDLHTDRWEVMEAGSVKGTYHRMVSHGNFLYLLTVNDGLWRYSIQTNSWLQVTVPPYGSRMGCSFVSRGNYLWIWGGRVGSVYANDLWRYDPTTDQWEEIVLPNTLPAGRRYHATAQVGGTIFIHGGQSAGSHMNDLWSLNLDLIA